MSVLNVWAWSKPHCKNFGDELGPDILMRLGHKVKRVPIQQAEVVTIGSVMHHIAAAPKGVVVAGAGIMHSHHKVNAKHMDVRLVRGLLTSAALTYERGYEQPFPMLGDPAILVADLYQPSPKKYRLGWVPHYIDTRTEFNVLADKTIDVLQPPDKVISEITSCDYILTSSLHALIIAQAYGIPAQRMPYPRVLGGDCKWLDYASGYAHADKGVVYSILEGL